MSKIVYESNDRFECILEREGGHTFLHLEVFKWGVSIRKELTSHLEKILRSVGESGEDYLFFYYEKPSVHKLANNLKPTMQEPIPLYKDGETYWLGVWEVGDK